MESPVIIKKSAVDPTFQDIRQRVATETPQAISNTEGFDAIYRDHKDYYNDKRFVIFDKNFQQMEDHLLGQFASSIDSNLVFDEKLVHVDDYKRKANLNVDFSHTPQVNIIFYM